MTNNRRKLTGIPAPLGDRILGVNRPLVESENKLESEIRSALDDERQAGKDYDFIAALAAGMGEDKIADVFRQAAEDERRHRREFEQILMEMG